MLRMDVFYALSDPTRRKILELLASRGQLTATEISFNFHVSPPAISQHLKVLREVNLVKMEKHAQQRIYQINPEKMLEVQDWSQHLAQQWNQRLEALDELLQVEKRKNTGVKKDEKMSNELTLKRIFDAPRDLVFKAWTDCSLLSKWWGPTGFTTPTCKVEARQGGSLYIAMHGPTGSEWDYDMPVKGVFEEFDPPKRFVFSNHALFDEKGEPQLSTTCSVTFKELGEKTEMTLHIVLVKSTPESAAAWAGAEMGWNQSLDKLSAHFTGRNADSHAHQATTAAEVKK
jgi:uncharacterized protein YndB with AHSA1/START domain/DNA-binding MarR family transcriptional regulator